MRAHSEITKQLAGANRFGRKRGMSFSEELGRLHREGEIYVEC